MGVKGFGFMGLFVWLRVGVFLIIVFYLICFYVYSCGVMFKVDVVFC